MQERTSLEDSLSGIGKVERELQDNIDMISLGECMVRLSPTGRQRIEFCSIVDAARRVVR